MNYVKIEVDKIRSYQTLVNKLGYRSYQTKAYKSYKEQMKRPMLTLTKVDKGSPLALKLCFNVKEGIDYKLYQVKNKETHRTSRNYTNLQDAEDNLKENQYIHETDSIIKYGVVGDVDNISKPVIDYLEELGIINNDRNVVKLEVIKTFGNSENTIEIMIDELETEEVIGEGK